MQAQKIVGLEGVASAIVIAEFHLENFRAESFHNRAHLAADETGFGHVAHQRYDGKVFEISHAPSLLIYITTRQARKAVIDRDDPAGADSRKSGRADHFEVYDIAGSEFISRARDSIEVLADSSRATRSSSVACRSYSAMVLCKSGLRFAAAVRALAPKTK